MTNIFSFISLFLNPTSTVKKLEGRFDVDICENFATEEFGLDKQGEGGSV